MIIKNSSKQRGFSAFVPFPLKIPERPELNVFPLNVLFMSFGKRDGKTITGTALYEPDLETFKQEGEKFSMKYRNVYGGNCWLLIEYDATKKSYLGEKFVNEKSVVMAEGTEWNMFFVHFTMSGLAIGERCKFEDV